MGKVCRWVGCVGGWGVQVSRVCRWVARVCIIRE